MSILTICFQAVNRSRRISEGLSSWLEVFFWLYCQLGSGTGPKCEIATYIRDLFLETVEFLDSVLEMVSNWGMMC